MIATRIDALLPGSSKRFSHSSYERLGKRSLICRVVVFISLSILVAGCEKATLDAQVRELCKQDGGIKVYEVVAVPSNRFDAYGSVYVPHEKTAKPSDDFYYAREVTYYRRGNPEMWRSHSRVYRRSDNKLLGEAVHYARRGGDMPGPWHPSSFACPAHADITDLTRKVFVRATAMGDQ